MPFKKRLIWISIVMLLIVGIGIYLLNYSLRDSVFLEDELDDKICSMTILQDQPYVQLCSDGREVMLLIATEDFSGHYFFNDIQQFVVGGHTEIHKTKYSSLIVLRNPDGKELHIQFTALTGGKLFGGEIVK